MATHTLNPDSLIGRTLGRYRIGEKIGAGGTGVVYRAHDEQLERDVALKVSPAGMAEGVSAETHLAARSARACDCG